MTEDGTERDKEVGRIGGYLVKQLKSELSLMKAQYENISEAGRNTARGHELCGIFEPDFFVTIPIQKNSTFAHR